ncbi:MAG: SPFH domain-containing protein, partial [Thermoguttaceae bacterium]|jgi:hypothetical protein
LGTLKGGILDLPGHYDELAGQTKSKVAEEFGKYGLELADFFINAITPPEEVQKAIDARSSMGAVGDLNAYLKFQAANSMAKMAEQSGAGGGLGQGALGMGMGAGFGMMMPGMIREAMAGGGASVAGPSPAPAAAGGAAAGMAAGPNFADLQAAVADPKAVVRTAATAAGYKIEESGDNMQITIPVGPLRKQRVTVEFGQKDADGNAVVNYWSVCGPFLEKNAAALLQYNTSTIHGAFAVKTIADKQMVVLQTNQPADTISALEVSKVLAAIAWQADQVEQKLLGSDEN